jgi:hypothetical protein
LHDRDHAGPQAFFFESGGGHELSYRLVSATGELTEKLAVMEKVDSQHLWDRKNPHGVRNVFEDFVVQERRKCGGALGVTRRAGCGAGKGEDRLRPSG